MLHPQHTWPLGYAAIVPSPDGLTQGDLTRIVERPIVAAFLVLAVVAMAAPMVMARLRFRGKRIELEQED